MNKFITKFLAFLILPILIVVIIDFWLRSQNSSYREKYDGLIENKDSVQVLLLGNSHTNYGVDPTEFSPFYAYNLANVGQKLYFDERIALKALPEGLPKLKYVFISIDYHSLYTERQGQREIWSYYGNGVKFKNENYFLANASPFLWGYTPQVSTALIKNKIKNYIKYGDKPTIDFNVEYGVNLTDTVKNGYIGYTGQINSRFDIDHYSNRAAQFEEPENSIRNEVEADLENFIGKLRARNIKPILFSPPTYSEYNAYLDTAIIRRNQQDINAICKKYKIPYWNYMTDDRFEKKDFFDMDHLNKKGAKLFSKMLSARLNNFAQSEDIPNR